jgi:hypothetical protein
MFSFISSLQFVQKLKEKCVDAKRVIKSCTSKKDNHCNGQKYYRTNNDLQNTTLHRGRSRGGGAHLARAPPRIGKNMIFWRKIVIFHTKYQKKNSRLPPLGAIFLSAPPPPNLKSWIRLATN